jgi:hypothetical protein
LFPGITAPPAFYGHFGPSVSPKSFGFGIKRAR